MSRCRMPARVPRWGSGLPSISVLFTYCVYLSVYGSLVTVSVREREVSRTVGQSALLSGPYCTLGSELKVEWSLYPSKTPFLKLTRPQCAPHPDGSGCSSTDRPPFITASHIGRIDFYPDNGSLLLRNLRSIDSGVYVITVYCGGQSNVRYNVTLTVHNGTEDTNSKSRITTGQPMPTSKDWRLFHLYRAALILLVIILFAISLLLSRTKKQMRCKLDATKKMDHSIGASREELDDVSGQ